MLLQERFLIAALCTNASLYSSTEFMLMQFCSPMNSTKIHQALLYGLCYPDHLSVAFTALCGPSAKTSIYIHSNLMEVLRWFSTDC